jgi:hypothetical protein
VDFEKRSFVVDNWAAMGDAYFRIADFFSGGDFLSSAGVLREDRRGGLRASLAALPAWNRAALLAAILMVSPLYGLRPWRAGLCDVLLAFAVARRWKDVKSNALEPGWVATKMGGPSAPNDLYQGCVTQAWLATSEDELARSTGGYFYHQRHRAPNPITADLRIQEELLAECGRISGIPFD